jgi:Tol biopolymer transport system component
MLYPASAMQHTVTGLVVYSQFGMLVVKEEWHMNRKSVFKAFSVVAALVITGLSIWAVTALAATMTEAGSPARTAIARLTNTSGNALRPVWSPDNQSIAFESNRDGLYHIYVMDADGSHQRALTAGPNEDRHAAWAADGTSIVYDSSDATHQDIWMVRVADGSRRQVTRVDGLAEYASVSPDGQRVAFYIYRDMTLNLWTVRIDGSEAKPVTRDLADASRHEPTMAWTAPGWSPDSRSLAYTGGDGRSIWTMRSDGSGARQVVSDGETNHFPWFRSDGRLAYITEYVPPKYDGAWTNAWALDMQTGKRTLLQEHMSMQGPMNFSADGTQVLFHSPRAGNFDIYRVDLRAPGGLAALQGTPAPGETPGY